MTYMRFRGAWYDPSRIDEVDEPLAEVVREMLEHDFSIIEDKGEGQDRVAILNDPCGTGMVYLVANPEKFPALPQLTITFE